MVESDRLFKEYIESIFGDCLCKGRREECLELVVVRFLYLFYGGMYVSLRYL